VAAPNTFLSIYCILSLRLCQVTAPEVGSLIPESSMTLVEANPPSPPPCIFNPSSYPFAISGQSLGIFMRAMGRFAVESDRLCHGSLSASLPCGFESEVVLHRRHGTIESEQCVR
ncbi:uncharacterized protein BJ171DRAFT_522991, partial [Polychytrium aggregatum]|uniref:uncharacterized protein n=1 Tax=Polychytrium aggregatum TaxID=110093 RepID=UPI0022FE3741